MAYIDTQQSLILVNSTTTPTAANFVETSEPVIVNPTPTTGDLSRLTGRKNSKETYVDDQHSLVDFSINVTMKGNDTTGSAPTTKPQLSEVYKICGLTETVGASDVTYTPSQGTIPKGNITVYNDGYKREITGAMGDFSIDFTVGEAVKFSATLKAYVSSLAATASANPDITSYEDSNTVIICNKISVVTVGGSTFNATSGSLKMNHELEDIYAVGIGEYESSDFMPTLDLEGFKTAGDEGDWTDLIDRTPKAIELIFGISNGEAIQILIPQAVPKEVKESEKQKKIGKSVTYECQNTSTVSGFELKYGNVIS